MAERDDVTSARAGRTKHEIALEVLERLDVTTQPGKGKWIPDDLPKLAEGLCRVPAADRDALKKVVIVRDKSLPPAVAGMDVLGESHNSGRTCSASTFNTTIHMHLLDAAFTGDSTPLWGESWNHAVVHEAGHVRVFSRQERAHAAMLQWKNNVGGLVENAKTLSGKVVIGPDHPPLITFRNKMNSCPYISAVGAANLAATAAAKMAYPAPPAKDPQPAEWREIVVALRKLVTDARVATTNASTIHTQAERSRANLLTIPGLSPEREKILADDATALAAIKAVLDATSSYLDAIVTLGGAQRQIEYFVWKMANLKDPAGLRVEPFTPFNDYGMTAHVEWFAETYALAALNSKALESMSPATSQWFKDGLPGLPTGLDPRLVSTP